MIPPTFHLYNAMPSACDATEMRSVREHFHNVEAASIAFCMRCGPNVWLTTLQKRTRSCICMALLMLLASHVVSVPYSPPTYPDAFIHPGKNNSFFYFYDRPSSRFLWFWVFYVLFLLLCQSWLISLFLFRVFHLQLVCFHFAMVYYLVCLYISSICCSAFSLSSKWSCSPCAERLLHCQASLFLRPCHYFGTITSSEICTDLLFKHVKAKDRDKKPHLSLSDVLLQKLSGSTLTYAFVFKFSSSIREVGKDWPGGFDMRALIIYECDPISYSRFS